jgi:hypothetical protein
VVVDHFAVRVPPEPGVYIDHGEMALCQLVMRDDLRDHAASVRRPAATIKRPLRVAVLAAADRDLKLSLTVRLAKTIEGLLALDPVLEINRRL